MSYGYHRMGSNVAGKVLPAIGIIRAVTFEVAPLPVVERKHIAPAIAETMASKQPNGREEAKAQGYTGDQCSHCNSMRMQIAGHCMVCADCGTTTGCS